MSKSFRANLKAVREPQTVAFVSFLMCVLGAVFYCYEYYLRVAPSVMGPELMHAYNLSTAGLGSLVAYYYWAYVPLQIPVGLMMDKWGPRRILTIACLACAFGTYLFAGTNIVGLAKIGRFLVGFGSAFAYVGVLKIATLWLPRKYFAMVAGLCTALGMLGAISGEILMAKFVHVSGWKTTLYTSAFVGIALSFALWMFIRDKSEKQVIERGRASHEGVSIYRELIEVIKIKQLWINGVIGCLAFLPLTVFAEMWAVSFLETSNLSHDNAALGSSLIFLGFGLGSPMWGRLSDVIGSRKKPLLIGPSLSGVVALWIVFFSASSNTILLYIGLFLCGFFASAQVLVFAVGNDMCRPGLNATTVSFTNLLVMLGGMVFQPIVGKILYYRRDIGEFGIHLIDYQYALALLPAGLLLGGVLAVFLKESYNLKN